MTCSAPPRELITFWLAGSLSPADAALVSSHVESCAECRLAAVEGLAVVKGFSELHLAADEVVAAAAGDLDAPHVLVCSRCRDEVALLRTINADLTRTSRRSGWIARLVRRRVPAREAGAQSETLPGRLARRWRPIGLAALAAAAASFVFWLGPDRPADDQTVLRGGAPAVVDLLPATTGADGVPTFTWTPRKAATRYRVSLFTEDGRLVWAREVASPPARWPDEVVRTAGAYRWRVEALAGGAVAARSRLAELEVRR